MKILYSLLSFLICAQLYGQQTITVAQQQFIQNRAKSKVKTYTEYLELLARTKSNEVDERHQIKQTIYLSFGKEGPQTRVNNDLIPASVLQDNFSMERSIQLESYLNTIAEHYRDGLSITFSNLEASEVYYSSSDNWFFVKVTADRKIQGIFQHGAEQTNIDTEDKFDFFVYANLINKQVKMGGIYGVQPHAEKDYTKAKIVKGEDTGGAILLIGKPLKVNSETVQRKFKRGKEYTITWEGGLADDIIQVELVPKDTIKIKKRQFNAMLNDNSFSFTPSTDYKIGIYQFKIYNISTGRYTQSGHFEIRRKIPLVATIGAGIAVGVGIYFIYNELQKDGGPDLPLPPDPPTD